MKRPAAKIIGACASLTLLLSSVIAPYLPVSAGVQSWTPELVPGSTGNIIGPAGIDVVDLCARADNQTAWAVTGATAGIGIYKTTNAGAAWTKLPNPPDISAGVSKVAAADNPDFGADWVAIIGDDNEVYMSGNGGASWAALPPVTGALSLNAIDISQLTSGFRTVAVVGSDGVKAKLWYFELGGFGASWFDATVSSIETGWDASNFMDTASDMVDLEFSPDFSNDRTMAALVKHGGGVYVQLAQTSTKKWNGGAFGGWGTGVFVTGTSIDTASLSLAPTFSGGDPAMRLAYVGAAGTSGSGLFRIDDTVVTTLSSTVKVNSVAVNAAGDRLAAGGYDTNDVWPVANPASANSSGVWPGSKRPGLDAPGVDERVVLAFAGANLFAGCTGAESAVSVSASGGQFFTDVGLVDSLFAPIDFTMSSDGTKMYVASYSAGVLSLWRKATVWERVLTWVRPASDFVVRAAPEDFDVVYVAERLTSGSSSMNYSNDGGQTRWSPRICYVAIRDLVVESASVLYAISPTNKVTKAVDGGYLWDNPRQILSFTPFSIVSLSPDNLLVGGAAGEVAYSTDGNFSWTRIPADIGVGNVQVTADSLADGGVIYAASSSAGGNVYRFTIGSSTDWTTMRTTAVNNASGIALGANGLHVLATSGADSTLYTTVMPGAATTDAAWSATLAAGRVFADAPKALLSSAGGRLWAINTAAHTIESCTLTTPPVVFTDNAAGVTAHAARLYGTLQLLGTAISVNVSFEWGTSSGFLTETTATQVVTATPASFYVDLGGLPSGATFYFRARAVGDGTGFGTERSLTTLSSDREVAIFRPGGGWFVDLNRNGAYEWGVDWTNSPNTFGRTPGDVPLVIDWNGDGRRELAVFRPGGTWFTDLNHNGAYDTGTDWTNFPNIFGRNAGDIPLAVDWDGDGREEMAIFRPGGTWFIDTNHDGAYTFGVDWTNSPNTFGRNAGDVPVAIDWDGDGRQELAIFRQGGTWFVDLDHSGAYEPGADWTNSPNSFGRTAGDVPLAVDWNGDDIQELGVFRPGGTWFFDLDHNGIYDPEVDWTNYPNLFGLTAGDMPLAIRGW